jgi:hypothetical protein
MFDLLLLLQDDQLTDQREKKLGRSSIYVCDSRATDTRGRERYVTVMRVSGELRPWFGLTISLRG